MKQTRSLFSRVGLWISGLFGAGSLESAPLSIHAAEPDRGAIWTADHAADWWAYLKSPVGQDLLARGRKLAVAQSAIACADVFHTAHSAGTANGWNQAMTWLESLSRASRVNEDPEPGRPQAEQATDADPSHERDELREHYAP